MTSKYIKCVGGRVVAAALALALPMAAQAEDYLKLELGLMAPQAADAHWQPPGYPADPEVSFDLNNLGTIGYGSVAVGHGFGNNLRADLELLRTGWMDASGPCASATDGTPCNTHSDISDAEVRSTAILANLSYDFATPGKFRPFVTVGLGVAKNKMSEWTRVANPGNVTVPANRIVRTFSEHSQSELAWTLGVGGSYAFNAGGRDMYVDVAYRYFDFGSVQGGATPISDPGQSPTKPLTFDMTSHALSMGLRIPF